MSACAGIRSGLRPGIPRLVLLALITVLAACSSRTEPPQHRYPAGVLIDSLPPRMPP